MYQRLMTLTLTLLSLFLTTESYGQDRKKAAQAIKEYMTSKHDNYKPKGFGEFFEQTQPEEVQARMGTDGQVKYTLVHSYIVDDNKVQDEYFHLNKDMKVLGKLSSQQMMDITMGLLFKSEKFMNILDSMGIDTTNNKRKFEKPKK